jgi:hypothetical protein
MKRRPAFADRTPGALLFVVAALPAVAIHVVSLQHGAITSLRHEAEMVVLGVSESAASQLSSTIVRTLSGPVEALSKVTPSALTSCYRDSAEGPRSREPSGSQEGHSC